MNEIKEIRTLAEHGHFYSPVVNPNDLGDREERLWGSEANDEVVGIDFDAAGHQAILNEIFPKYVADYDYPEYLEETQELNRFYTKNSQFGWLDSYALFVLLREWKPKRLIEVGSGFSTLLSLDISNRFLNGGMEVTCIEPYPRSFLLQKHLGLSALIKSKVQDVDVAEFLKLKAGDVLFIDSSHVAKTGSDVNYLYFEVLPRLEKGVLIHIHDIFLPNEYPKDWVLTENRSWNEQYVLRALLMFSNAFKVRFGSSFACSRYPDLVKRALAMPNGDAFGGGSLWIERV